MNHKPEFWLVVGSQLMYGTEVIDTIETRAKRMASEMSAALPYELVYKLTAKSGDEITRVVKEANFSDECAGVVTWCHTFSPSKMWIAGLASLNKPYCHLATQYNEEIPNDEIDMNYMNLNQSAHGDREHGFVAARLRVPRKVIAGFWKDAEVLRRLGDFMRCAIGIAASRSLRLMRFGDNMRQVAVTEGDKVECQIKLGWEVNTHAVGDLVAVMNSIKDSEVNALVETYKSKYTYNEKDLSVIKYQAREELAMKRMLDENGCRAYTNTFEDLHGMEQLPGLASQHLMAQGYGYGGEGDWKVSAMTAIMKAMGEGGNGESAFMEDYTYHMASGGKYILGAHMLEVCPSIAANKPAIEVHHLGIGGKNPPARLVFEGKAGPAIVVSLVDMGGRLRLICQDIECVKPIMPMPNLPVARVMWKVFPTFESGVENWIVAGGAHHTTLSYDVSADMMRDFARIMDIEFVHLTNETTPEKLERELFIYDRCVGGR